jgi:iron complex outermembrane receptor protein
MRSFKLVASAAATSAALLIPLHLAAGEGTADSGMLEEVIVTAEFRQAKLQDTPIAITAISGDALEARGMTSLADIGKVAPNVNISSTGAVQGPSAAIYIRGVGQYDSNLGYEPGVGVYVDDVYHGALNGNFIDLLDLERVEVLRGPQGTLSGRNSIGGAIKLYARTPKGDNSGYAEATIGEDNKAVLRAAFDIPLLKDVLFLRVSGMSSRQDGYVQLLDYRCTHPTATDVPLMSVRSDCKTGTLGGKDVTGLRGALRWLASDAVEVNLNADYIRDKSEVSATTLVLMTVPPFAFPDLRFASPSPYVSYYRFTDQNTLEHFPNISATDSRGVGLTVDWKLGENLTLKSISGYRWQESQYSNDQRASSANPGLNHSDEIFEQSSEELHLSGVSFNKAIDWTLGAYYFKSNGHLMSRVDSAPVVDVSNNNHMSSTSKSGFGHVVWHAFDRFNVTGGARYTQDEKSYQFGQSGATAIGALNGLTTANSGNRTDYRLGVDFRWNDALMTYAQYSTGYKGGGINPRPIDVTQVITFNPEFLAAYEIGLKSDMLNKTLRLNLSAFYNKYTDIILVNSGPCCGPLGNPFFSITAFNAGDANIKGAEAELDWSPVKGLTVNASGSWLQFDYTRIATQTSDGSPLAISIPTSGITPYTPEKTASLGISYAIPLLTHSTLTPRIDASYQGARYSDPSNRAASYLDAYTVYNARLTWDSANSTWQAVVAVDNLGNKVYYPGSFDATPFSGTLQKTVARPRTASLTLRRNF